MEWSVLSTSPILEYPNPSSPENPSPHFVDSSVQHFHNLHAIIAAMISTMEAINEIGTLTVSSTHFMVFSTRYNNSLLLVIQIKWMSSISILSSSSDFPFLSFVFHKMVQSTSSLVGVHWQRFFPFGSFGVWQSCRRHKSHLFQWQLQTIRSRVNLLIHWEN